MRRWRLWVQGPVEGEYELCARFASRKAAWTYARLEFPFGRWYVDDAESPLEH